MLMADISIVLPTYNERENIADLISSINAGGDLLAFLGNLFLSTKIQNCRKIFDDRHFFTYFFKF
jgi:hypothetical protein